MRYASAVVDGMQVLAHDPAGAGRIVEVFGRLVAAGHVAIVVPGNAHDLASYRHNPGGASPRRNGIALYDALREQSPEHRCAVIVWLGYACPRGFLAAANRRAAEAGARDLRALIHRLPSATRITVVGHSYGSLVAAAASDGSGMAGNRPTLASVPRCSRAMSAAGTPPTTGEAGRPCATSSGSSSARTTR